MTAFEESKEQSAVRPKAERSHQIITLSARSNQALQQYAAKLRRHLDREPKQLLGDLAYTLHRGQRLFDHRLALVAGTREELKALLEQVAEGELESAAGTGRVIAGSKRFTDEGAIAFLFTGQGSQYSGMGRELYESSAVFRQALDECAAILAPHFEVPFLDYLFDQRLEQELNETRITQPALFVLEYALAQWWLSIGIRPSVVIGHSLGEYVAACLAGAFALEDALFLVMERGRLMQELCERGAMTSVLGTVEQVQADLAPFQEKLSIAVVNSEKQVVVAGDVAAMEQLRAHWQAQGVVHKSLPVSHAFHSPLIEPMLQAFAERVRGMQVQPLQLPLVSNISGEVLPVGTVLDADYWGKHLRETVQFGEGLQTLVAQEVDVLLEVGPHPVLKKLADQAVRPEQLAVGSLTRGEDGWKALLKQVGRLFVQGVRVDWAAFDAEFNRRRVHVPTYPFERKSYWIEADRFGGVAVASSRPEAAAAKETALTTESERSSSGGKKRRAFQTVTQQMLGFFWQEVLGVENIAPNSDFFELGGDSLNIIQLQARIRETLGETVEFNDFFTHSQFADMAAHIESLKGASGTAAAGSRAQDSMIPRLPEQEHYELSYAQQRMWFLHQLDNTSAVYHIPFAVRVTGALQTEAMEQSLNGVLKRHAVLRTVFRTVEERPVQVILPECRLALPLIDLSAVERADQEAQINALLLAEVQKPFDLQTAPLLRALLVKVAAEEHVLVLTAHHIVWDGWSMGVFVQEMMTSYQALAVGHTAELPELPIQYVDFAEWQKEWLQGDVLQTQLAYWQQKLGGELPVLQLPTDRPRQAVQTYNGRVQKFRIGKGLMEQLTALSQREGATLYMTLLAAFQAFLHLYTGQEDILVGSANAGRRQSQLERLIGFFVNTLVLRTEVAGELSFRELLGRVRETATEAYAHQDVPFEMLVDALKPERNLSYSPLFQVMFNLQNAPMSAIELPGLGLTPLEVDTQTAMFDLLINLVEDGDGLDGSWQYNTDLFSATLVEQMLNHFLALLEQIALHPEQALADLDYLSAAEVEQLLNGWNDTVRDYPQDVCLHELIEAQAAKTPDAPAVVFEGQTLTYRELNRLANRLAHHLRTQGVGPEVLVGICMERSLEMVIGLLGILKAGGAYVPLDPSYPQDRLAAMIEDAQATVLLTQDRLLDLLQVRADASAQAATVICLDAALTGLLAEGAETLKNEQNPPCTVTADNAAYMIFTSGSTGRPKGVLNTHKGIVNRLLWMQDEYQLTAADRVLQKTPFSFDVSVWEFFWPLLTGACLVVARPEGHRDSSYLVDLIEKEQITTLHFVPSMLQVFLEDPGVERCTSIRQVMCSGEAMPYELQERFFVRLGAKLHNLYGPTEAAVDVTYWECQPGSPLLFVPIGHPVANTQIYILNRQLRPVPVGVAGELHIGGVQVARGYHQRPELTAEKFIADPYRAGNRLYKTGDLARFLPDGTVQYLGRLDHQVKIRGLRIELGEIETVLTAHPQVRECLVLVREDVPGDKRLVAYLVLNQTAESADAPDVRSHCQGQLPEYMIPSAFVVLEAMPLTSNGKLDRKALPAPDRSALEVETYVEPRTALEQQVASVWAQVLSVEQVGALDHFFLLGGHSLLATQAMSRINAEFGLQLPLRSLFEAPVVADFALLVEKEQTESADDSAKQLPIVPISHDGELPLSFAQQRLWLIDQLIPGSSVYNVPFAVRLQGALHLQALEKSLNEILHRHESLRTVFVVKDQQPVQVIQPFAEQTVPVVDLRLIAPEEREAEMKRLVQEAVDQPFDLEQGPVMRALLLQMSEQEHVFVLNMHHIVSDGWSMGVFVREFTALYAAFAQGLPSPLPKLTIQYADYAHWQREWMQGEALDEQMAYWKRQLGGELPILSLPTDRPRSPQQTYRGASESIVLSKRLSEALHQLSQQAGTTLFMTLLGAFQTLLYRYTGQVDIAVGSPIAGRSRQETEELIGFFVNTLVMRTDLSGNPSFAELLRRVREVTLGAYAHQDVPFEKLVDELQPNRDMSRSPLFQVLFILQNSPLPALELPGLTVYPVEWTANTAKFDLTFTMIEQADGLAGALEYNTDLFYQATIRRLLNHFENLLSAVTVDPETTLAELPMLSEAERQQLLVEWNETKTAYPSDASVHELFAQQAQATPDAVAVVLADRTLTYRELDAQSNQLARHLQKKGVAPASLVGICMERSLEMIIGLLAILKTGAAYVPLDPNYPAERLAYLLEDTAVRVLVTQERYAAQLPAHQAKTICLDSAWADIMQESEQPLTVAADADSLAYVSYTSGSTGRPKGVCIPHRGIVRLVKENSYVSFGSDEVFLQFASISFDASTFEIWGSLLNGAKLVLFPAIKPSLDELGQVLREQQVTTLWLTAGLFHQMVDENVDDLASVRQLLAGGDVVSPAHVKKVLDRLPNCTFINGYGPTESTTFACCYAVTDSSQIDRFVPIGRPIANTQVYVLDRELQPVPVGVVGELYIGGDGLAREYLNQPELTAERFVANPFADLPGACSRLYKTGDFVRYAADGTLEFIGRIDNQVKIRGFRIELGEIETALTQHPAVQEAIVLALEDRPGSKRLVAYAVVDKATEVSVPDLRESLVESLPEYMMPNAFVLLDEFPLTANGKVDRRALPTPDAALQRGESAFVAPRTALESQVAEIWANVLSLEQISTEDNFFELGGHSLLATQVISRCQAEFGLQIPLRNLFEAPTLADFAARIQQQMQQAELEGAAQPLPPLVPMPRQSELPLSFAQQRLWVIDQILPGTAVYNVPFAVRLHGALHHDALANSLNEILRRHEALRTTFVETSAQPVQQIHPPARIELPTVDLRDWPDASRDAELERLIQTTVEQPFDLQAGPLVRFLLLRLADEEHVLVLTMHHIVSDGWSMGVFAKEFAALYEAFATGLPSPLIDLPIQYADYTFWQHQWLQGEVLEQQLAYWKRQLGGERPVLQLPTDRPRQAVQTNRGAVERLAIPQELTAALHALSQKHGTTLFMTLLGAFQTLLHRYTGQEDLFIGTPIAGRNAEATENLIGFFVNTLVLRGDLAGDPTFAELLARVRETTLGAFAHQDLPFEKLVEELQPERDMSRTPLFQVMFVLQNAPFTSVELPGLAMEPLELESKLAKFDLTFSLVEQADGLVGAMEYNTDLFDAATIRRLLTQFANLLEAVSADEHRAISTLPLLTAEEHHALLHRHNEKTATPTSDTTLHEWFERQALQTPDAVAVVYETESFTYRELNERANRLAHHLQTLGVGPETLVGLYAERSLQLMVGLLAILKAGGAYLPMDPVYPADRLAFMAADSQIEVLLTEEKWLDSVPSGVTHIFCLDRDWPLLAEASTANPPSMATADSLAYVIYTSGSTGKPKGVLIPHRNVVRLFRATEAWYAFDEHDVWTMFHSFAFDFSVWEIWGAWLYGGKLVVVPYLVSRSPEDFHRLLCQEKVTVLNQTPSAFRQLIQAEANGGSADKLALRYVIFGGEALELQSLKPWFDRHGDAHPQLVNMYGITETTVHVTYRPIGLQDVEQGKGSVIGVPIPDLQVYVLDQHLQPVPYGVTGEMYVGGAGVARGYLQRADLTAERFLADPFASDPNARLYKTGDLARRLPNGELEYQGRIDSQVKIRGFRIELGEIEALLVQREDVREAVVLAREDVPGDQRLVAYLVVKEALDVRALRDYLHLHLPDYMVPSAFVMLDAFPLTANGKVDARALPAPSDLDIERKNQYVPPRDTTEVKLVRLWEEVLGVSPVGVRDNFFDLGGHSLLAVRLMGEMQSRFGHKLALATLYQEGTIEQLAESLRQGDAQSANASLVQIQAGDPLKKPLFLVHPAGGIVHSYVDLTRELPQQPVYGLQSRGLDDEQTPFNRVEDMAAHYIAEIRTVQPAGPYLLGGWSVGGSIALEMAQQLKSQGEEVALLAMFDTHSPTLGLAEQKEMSDADLAMIFVDDMAGRFGVETEELHRLITEQGIDAGLAELLEAGKRQQAVPPAFDLVRLRRYFDVFKANFQANWQYRPTPYAGTITLFRAEEARVDHATLGFGEVGQEVQVHAVPGNHNTMIQPPHVETLAERLRQCLELVQETL